MINVTKSYLPDIEKYKAYIDEIYSSSWLTNNGPMVQKLELRLKEYLGVKNIILVSNGTIALDVAYKVLELKGEIITTPFSFVATTSSAVLAGLKPIFADIDENSLNINPQNIEKMINQNTSAILPVHVFANACEVEEIEKIAKKYNLKVIYDAAHAFDVEYKSESILKYGDISTLSFHATKLFHTIEGGAIITNDDELAQKIRYFINFGIKSATEIPYIGTNAKMNEFEAAMGLCILDDIKEIKNKRKVIIELYKKELDGIVKFQEQNINATQNYSYMPVIFKSKEELLSVQKALNTQDIYPRRYFYPSLDTLEYLKSSQICEISQNISQKILCLPVFVGLKEEMVLKICRTIREFSR
ncbi:MAG: DegT/DnrJ/EryC1/StrS family aminotransferase [Arcobacteraceae bacterium]|nr:DegT/DnrJ/EryC1/StrS family aminotransferase [Arcobacteraceae bacterium]